MILDLTSHGRLIEDVPEAWRPYVRVGPDSVDVVGHPTAEHNIYVYGGTSWCAAATELAELLAAMSDRGEPIEVSPFGVSALLHNGLVPVPGTVYRGVHHLAMGDTASIRDDSGGLRISLTHDYPWLPDRSTGTNEPDTDVLLDLLTDATEQRLTDDGGGGVLMMSSGKDSIAIALALAEAGLRGVTTVTYRTGPDDPEPPIARSIARRLGLEHRVVDLPTESEQVSEALLRFFRANVLPGTDLSQIPYVIALASVGAAGGTVLDGGGNDPYMGYLPKGVELAKLRYRVRGRRSGRVAQRLGSVASPLNYAARSAPESTLPGRTPRMHHVRELYPEAEDVYAWWHDVGEGLGRTDPQVLYSVVNERHTHPTQTVMKQRLAANAVGMTSALPWADRQIADYYFDLPVAYRYDTSSGENKVLLRQMLRERLAYDAAAVGKHYFEFDGARFVTENRDFVWSEIEASPLWDPAALPMVRRWIERVDAHPVTYHAVLTVFMISGWSNHSPFSSAIGASTPATVSAP